MLFTVFRKKFGGDDSAPQKGSIMEVHFKGSLAGMSIDKTFTGDNADVVVVAFRNHIAGKIPSIPFTKKDDNFKEQLDVDGLGDWTNAEFYTQAVNYWNSQVESKDRLLTVPQTAQEFIDLCVAKGFAKVV